MTVHTYRTTLLFTSAVATLGHKLHILTLLWKPCVRMEGYFVLLGFSLFLNVVLRIHRMEINQTFAHGLTWHGLCPEFGVIPPKTCGSKTANFWVTVRKHRDLSANIFRRKLLTNI